MSAIVTAVIDPMIQGIGLGWTFTVLGGLMLSAFPSILILRLKGPEWRAKRSKQWGPTVAAPPLAKGDEVILGSSPDAVVPDEKA